MVPYNVWAGAPCSQARAIIAVIQEVKRNIVHRRYKRETTNNVIHCNCTRLRGYVFITVRKMEG